MKYSVTLIEVESGLSLFIPDPAILKATYEQLLAKDPDTSFPFWAKIWASSKALTDFLKTKSEWIQGKKVLEMGAGIGVPSFSIAHLVNEIIISDYNKDAVKLLEKNIAYLNLKNTKAMCLDWNNSQVYLPADIVLLSDINYAPDQFNALLLVIKQYLMMGARIIIATPQRIMGISFIKAIEAYITYADVITIIEENLQTDISILMLSKNE